VEICKLEDDCFPAKGEEMLASTSSANGCMLVDLLVDYVIEPVAELVEATLLALLFIYSIHQLLIGKCRKSQPENL
jgi:hypothetical protein